MGSVVIAVWLLAAVPAWADAPVWEPARTWVFAVGVLNFDSALHGWPDEGRVDAILLETLRKRGVPEEQILFIKNKEATKEHVTEKLVEFLQRPGEGDTLVFYYTGHGGRDYNNPKRPVNFILYETKSTWTVSSMLDAIEEHFQGSRVLLAADCCHSGALAEEASRRSGKIGYGVLTSAHSNSVSTGNWTFTQCLVDVFRGNPALDANGDGAISFKEAAQYCDAEMCFCEDQRATHEALAGFPADLVLARIAGERTPRIGEHCEGQLHGVWMKGKIVAAKDGKFLIDWVGREKLKDAWLAPDKLRPHEPAALEAGTRVQIQWNREWFPGRILETKNGLHLVHYDGYPPADNEWVPLRRLRPQP
jgi:hypothetical protein